MQIVLLAVAILIIQAPPPMPGQTVKGGSGGKNTSQNNRAPEEQPVMPTRTATLQAVQPQGTQNGGSQSANEQEEEARPVRVVNPLNVRKDWLDYGYIIATVFLAIGTLALALYAKAQASHIVNSERAWIIVNADSARNVPKERPQFLGYVWNSGKTPAVITKQSVGLKWITSLDALPEIPPAYDYSKEIHEVVVPGPANQMGNYNITAQGPVLDSGTLADFSAGRGLVYVYGLLEYLDAFKKRRKTHFGFYWFIGSDNDPKARWKREGPRSYNENT